MKTTDNGAAEALIDAARDIFVADGLPGVSVGQVAEREGCTTMWVYSRFDSM
jgi:AcrR family transcriptional regulator